LPSSKREEKHTAASDPDGDNTDGNQVSTAALRAVDDGILLRRRRRPNITVGAKKILAFAREINFDPGQFITISDVELLTETSIIRASPLWWSPAPAQSIDRNPSLPPSPLHIN